MPLPRFRDLPDGGQGVDKVAWGVFGPGDEMGTVNLLQPDRVLGAAREIRTGEVFALNWEAGLPDPHPFGRVTPRRFQTMHNPLTRDDYVDHLHLQYSSQWDGLRHIGLPEGFYNGVPAAAVDGPDHTLGIQGWARQGIVGRGVLLDVARWLEDDGRPIDHRAPLKITPADLEEVTAAEGVAFIPGDILLIRTGWTEWYERLPLEERRLLGPDMPCPGLEASPDMAEWIWDRQLAAVAADNMAVEAMPLGPNFPLQSLHGYLIAGYGMPVGELLRLGDLAAACASDRRWLFFFAAAPLNIPGGVGSPANSLAVR